MRGTWVYRDGELVEKHLAKPLISGYLSRSIKVCAPYVNSDTHTPFQSMADGKIYDSKSAYRASLAEHGMQEIGNEVAAHMERATGKRPKGAVKTHLIEAYQKVKSGYVPAPAPIVHSIGTPDLD